MVFVRVSKMIWLNISCTIKVRDYMKNWGCINSDRCASCSRKETTDHCFLNCARVKAVWSHFSPVLSSLLGVNFLPTCLFIFFFQWPRVGARNERLARFLVKTILYGIWKFRNKSMRIPRLSFVILRLTFVKEFP